MTQIFDDTINLTDEASSVGDTELQGIAERILQRPYGEYNFTVKGAPYAPTHTTIRLQIDDLSHLLLNPTSDALPTFDIEYVDDRNAGAIRRFQWRNRAAADPGDGSTAILLDASPDFSYNGIVIGGGAGQWSFADDAVTTHIKNTAGTTLEAGFRIFRNNSIQAVGGGTSFLEWVDPTASPHNATADGAADDNTELSSADTAAGTNGVTYIGAGKTYRLSTEAAAPTFVSKLHFDNGGKIDADNVVVTLDRVPYAGPYKIFDRSNGGSVVFSASAEGGEVLVDWFGTDAAAIGDAIDSLAPRMRLKFSSGRTYTIATPVAARIPNYTVVEAWGALIQVTADIVGLDLNPGASASDPESTLIHLCRWHGGFFENTSGTKVNAVGLRIYTTRNCHFEHIRFEKFKIGMDFVARDSMHISNCHAFNCITAFESPDWLTDGSTTIHIQFYNPNLINTTDAAYGINILGKWSKITISHPNVAMAGTVGQAATAIHTVAAGVGGNFGSAARGLTVKDGHFEQGNDYTTYIHCEDNSSPGTATSAHRFESNGFGQLGGGPVAIKLERVQNAVIASNEFQQTVVAGGVPVEIDDNCENIIFEGNTFPDHAIRYTGGIKLVTRKQLSYHPIIRNLAAPETLAGYNEFVTGSRFTGLLDMSVLYSEFPAEEDIPKAYTISFGVKDGASALASPIQGPSATIRSGLSGGADEGIRLNLNTRTHDEWIVSTGTVDTSTIDGDIYLGLTPTHVSNGPATSTVSGGETASVDNGVDDITRANPAVVTATAHGFSNGEYVTITGVTDMVEINGLSSVIANVTANTFEMTSIDSTTFTQYAGGGGGTATKAYIVDASGPTWDLSVAEQILTDGGALRLNLDLVGAPTGEGEILAISDANDTVVVGNWIGATPLTNDVYFIVGRQTVTITVIAFFM